MPGFGALFGTEHLCSSPGLYCTALDTVTVTCVLHQKYPAATPVTDTTLAHRLSNLLSVLGFKCLGTWGSGEALSVDIVVGSCCGQQVAASQHQAWGTRLDPAPSYLGHIRVNLRAIRALSCSPP